MSDVVGVDVGGTKIAAVRVDAAGQVLADATVPSPVHDADLLAEAICCAVQQVVAHRPSAVGVAAAGYISADRSTVLFSPNIEVWREEPLQQRLSAALGAPVTIENDANAAAWAEYVLGVGQGTQHMVMVTLGTGVGSGLVLNGQLYRGGHGIAAELGHTLFVPDGAQCGCGQRGCLEQYAAGRVLGALGMEAIQEAPSQAAALLALTDDGVTVQGWEVTQAALAGDELSQRVLRTFGDRVGRALADVTAVLDPQMLVLGGGVVAAGDLLLEPVRQGYLTYVTGGRTRPVARVELAQAQQWAGAVGAALLSQQQ